MKQNLKKLTLGLVCAAALFTPAMADNDKPITVQQLPQPAQQFINQHFAGQKVQLAKMESGLLEKSYDVMFAGGAKVEFDRNGAWTEVCHCQNGVPAAIVPAAISQYVKDNYADCKITRIEKDGSRTEVELSNDFEITFNKNMQVTDIDL